MFEAKNKNKTKNKNKKHMAILILSIAITLWCTWNVVKSTADYSTNSTGIINLLYKNAKNHAVKVGDNLGYGGGFFDDKEGVGTEEHDTFDTNTKGLSIYCIQHGTGLSTTNVYEWTGTRYNKIDYLPISVICQNLRFVKCLYYATHGEHPGAGGSSWSYYDAANQLKMRHYKYIIDMIVVDDMGTFNYVGPGEENGELYSSNPEGDQQKNIDMQAEMLYNMFYYDLKKYYGAHPAGWDETKDVMYGLKGAIPSADFRANPRDNKVQQVQYGSQYYDWASLNKQDLSSINQAATWYYTHSTGANKPRSTDGSFILDDNVTPKGQFLTDLYKYIVKKAEIKSVVYEVQVNPDTGDDELVLPNPAEVDTTKEAIYARVENETMHVLYDGVDNSTGKLWKDTVLLRQNGIDYRLSDEINPLDNLPYIIAFKDKNIKYTGGNSPRYRQYLTTTYTGSRFGPFKINVKRKSDN